MTSGNWSLERDDRAGGTFRVIHSAAEAAVYRFQGAAQEPIRSVSLNSTLGEVAVHLSDGTVRLWPLRAPNAPAHLAPHELERFDSLLAALESACREYQYLEDYSADFPIPGYAVKEASDQVELRWAALLAWVRDSGLSQHASTVFIGGTEHPRLTAFFSQSHHKAEDTRAYWVSRRMSAF